MATTAIWDVRGWLGKLVIYAENPDKTENPAFYQKPGMTDMETQGLTDVIEYAVRDEKVRVKAGIANETSVMRHFVTGVNCTPSTARDEMLAAKKRYGKDDGIVAFHGYQSFAPGEVTPGIAHEIGIKMAHQLWGERFQVIVATHLDKANHIHNHYVINSVSFTDGYRYNDCTATYMQMRKVSDKLCREYGLSVIEEPKRGKSKHYGEWKAEQDGKPTYRSMLKADIDQAILESMTERQLWDNLYKKGYRIKFGKDITLRPPGKDRGLKLMRNFGEDYSIEGIRKRILANTRPQRIIIPPYKPPKRVRFVGKLHTAKKVTGLRALYFSYLYKMGVLPRKREPSPKRVYFLFREDIRHMQNIAKETRLLVKHGIDTAEQLTAHMDGITNEMASLSDTRKRLRNQLRSIRDDKKLEAVKTEIADLSNKIGELRKDVRLCEDIEKRSVRMKENIRREREDEKSKGKEHIKHESFRGRR